MRECWSRRFLRRFRSFRDHLFIDENKRIGAHAMLTLLLLNGIELEYTQQKLSDIILPAAAGGIGYDGLLM